MAWIYLFLAAAFEVQWAVTMKYTQGFSRFWPSVACLGGMAVSVWLLALAQRTLPVGTSYAVWTGLGAAGTAICGMFLFNESRELARIGCILLIVSGVVGLGLLGRSD